MAIPLREMHRAITQQAIRMAIAATARVSVRTQHAAVRRAMLLAAGTPGLRRRVLANMRLALGEDVPDEVARRYFHRVGWFFANALATFHHGVEQSTAISQVDLGSTISVLDEAFAEGRGVVLASPHWAGHELVAALVARRHPMVMLVRQATAAEQTARKLRWYQALGVETVMRAAQASPIEDAVAYLRALRQRKVLGITPDLLAGPGQGLEISLFGRPARVHSGAFALALAAGAPVVRVSAFVRQPDERIILTFERAPSPSETDRDAAIRSYTQDWFRWFEDRLRQSPEHWLFWLDRRWDRFLRATPRSQAK